VKKNRKVKVRNEAVNIHCSLKNAKKLAIYLCFIRQKSRDRDYTHEIGS
jgi:hypothetical protein